MMCVQKFVDAFEVRQLFLKSDTYLREQVLTPLLDQVVCGGVTQDNCLNAVLENSEIQVINLDSLVLSGDCSVPADFGDFKDAASAFTFFDENVLVEALKAPVEGSLSEVAKQQHELSTAINNDVEVQLIVTAEDDELCREMDPGDSFKKKNKATKNNEKSKVVSEEAKEFLKNNQKEDKFYCLHCSKVFPNQTSYRRHRNYHKLAKTKCPLCTRSFTHKSNLKRHMLLHKGARLICDRCEKKFSEPVLLYEHLKLHRVEDASRDSYVMKCNLCGEETCSYAIFTNHMRSVHSVTEKVKPFVCKICNLRFTSKQGMFRHIDNIHENNRRNLRNRDKNYLCNDCGKSFHTNFHLEVHIRSHTGVKPYTCPVCNKSFSQLSGLKMHTYIHTGEKKYSCEVCGKRFTQFGHVKEHLLIHTNEKPFQCQICNHSFRVKGNLSAHMQIHLGKKHFECSYCNKKFLYNTKLKNHMEKTHLIKQPPVPIKIAFDV